MSRRGRGSTGPGRPAAVPTGGYAPPAPVREEPGGPVVVAFHGDDGRQGTFDVSTLPLPGWHEALAAAFAGRTGPAGGLRTFAAAGTGWGALGRLVRFLASLPDPPATPGELTPAHLDAFGGRRAASTPATALRDLAEARQLLTSPALRDLVRPEVVDHVQRRLPAPRGGQPTGGDSAPTPPRAGTGRPPTPTTGFSDGELARLLAALRSDAAAVRDRIRTGEDLLRRYQADPQALATEEQALGRLLEHAAATGEVGAPPGAGANPLSPERHRVAGRLFLTLRDLPPLMMLAAALTERNGETIKELPVRHRLLEDRAVELVIVKRRRGARRWYETVTWEIGPAGRELHTPGGFYLLLLELTARSRALCGSPLLWCVWRNGHGARLGVADDHYAPFEKSLKATPILPTAWAANRPRPLLADPQPVPPGPAAGPAGTAPPLLVSFNRIKTSMEVRRTKRMGGHLPSAAKSNTMPVLFRNYLSGDPVITAWAEEVVGEALADAEQSALAAHQRAVRAAGAGPRVVAGPASLVALAQGTGLDPQVAGHAAAGELDTAWAACLDHDRHPATRQPCQVSFLDCFHCGNCLVTRDHLPRLLGLLDALAQRRQQIPEDDWWARYGPAWAAARHDILTEFTPAELEQAQADKPADALLDLVENPWELP